MNSLTIHEFIDYSLDFMKNKGWQSPIVNPQHNDIILDCEHQSCYSVEQVLERSGLQTLYPDPENWFDFYDIVEHIIDSKDKHEYINRILNDELKITKFTNDVSNILNLFYPLLGTENFSNYTIKINELENTDDDDELESYVELRRINHESSIYLDNLNKLKMYQKILGEIIKFSYLPELYKTYQELSQKLFSNKDRIDKIAEFILRNVKITNPELYGLEQSDELLKWIEFIPNFREWALFVFRDLKAMLEMY